jgi:hypothetical protein
MTQWRRQGLKTTNLMSQMLSIAERPFNTSVIYQRYIQYWSKRKPAKCQHEGAKQGPGPFQGAKAGNLAQLPCRAIWVQVKTHLTGSGHAGSPVARHRPLLLAIADIFPLPRGSLRSCAESFLTAGQGRLGPWASIVFSRITGNLSHLKMIE